MKKLFALLLVLVMMLTLVACGGDKEPTNDNDNKETTAAKDDNKEITGETFNAGNFSALVPEGWMEVVVKDMWADDPNAVDPDKLQIIKDGTSEFDILTKAYVQIDYYGPETDMMAPSSEWYEGAADLEPVVAGGYTWKGFSAVSGGNPMTVLYTGEAGGPQFQATLWSNGSSTISATDADVLAILESVKPAA
ncbi:MAG: hypothetical protein IKM59_04290 [Oscillospiraceae bacterium]|nr:hypothetical protein [Oscillospiraceae bacterium]